MPPEAPQAIAGTMPPAASFCLTVMRTRPQFLAAARAHKHVAPTMLVQARDRRDGDSAVHVGFTCSKKLGNAVRRNRAKRRLRAVAHELLPQLARPGWDYVLIGKAGNTIAAGFPELQRDLTTSLERLHK